MKRVSPRVKLFQVKYVDNFNPKEPSEDLIDLFKETTLPKSSYLNKGTRGKLVSELTLDQAEFIAFDLENGSDKMKDLVRLFFFCKLYANLEKEKMSEEDFDMFVKEEFTKNKDDWF